MAHDVKTTVEQNVLKLEELSSEDEEDALTSFLHKFTTRDEDGVVTLVPKYPSMRVCRC